MKKYEVKIKGKLKGNEVVLTSKIEITQSMLMEVLKTKALEQAQYDGITNTEITEVTEIKESKLEQMSIPFEDPSEEETESTESMETESRPYTPYNAIKQQQKHQEEIEEDSYEESESDSEEEYSEDSEEDCCDSYTPYASMKRKKVQEQAISYHPKFTNGYAPYRTRRIIIESKNDIS
jgi:hypothetical protein